MSLITLGLGETNIMAPISVNVIVQLELEQDDVGSIDIEIDGADNLELELKEC